MKLLHAEPILQVYSKYTYSVEVVKMFNDIIEETLEKINLIEISDEEEEGKATRSKKRLHQQEYEDDDDADEDELFRLLGKKCGPKKKNAKLFISQQVSVKNENVTRKCTTPGESGQFLIKIEITDCETLKDSSQINIGQKSGKNCIFS